MVNPNPYRAIAQVLKCAASSGISRRNSSWELSNPCSSQIGGSLVPSCAVWVAIAAEQRDVTTDSRCMRSGRAIAYPLP
ncbi:hypothetical protein [Thermoleptolyngbya sp.]